MPRGSELLWAGGGALLNGVIARALPQTLAPQYNVGWTGYGMNVLAGMVGAWGIGKINRRAGNRTEEKAARVRKPLDPARPVVHELL